MIDLRMPDVNNIVIAGNLTRDPAFRKTTNGTPVTNFWIASNRRFKDNNGQWRENVCYVGVVAWYKLAENCAENLRKGSAVIIEGELQSRSFRAEDGRNRNIVEIKARRVQFLNKKNNSGTNTDQIESLDIQEPDMASQEVISEDTEINTQISSPSEVNAPDEQMKRTEPGQQTDEIQEEKEDNPDKGKFDFGFQNLEL